MARRINLAQTGDYAADQFEKLLRVTVLNTDRKLKEESPVLTGRFRSSWVVSENDVTEFEAEGAQISKDVKAMNRQNYQQEKLGGVYHISNSLPYAEALCYGTNLPPSWKAAGVNGSLQNPPGWVDLIAAEITASVRASAEYIARSS
jgi:hypothetical protein